MDKDIENMLEAITKVVDRNDIRWTQKRDMINAARQESEMYETAFDELISWFEKDTE